MIKFALEIEFKSVKILVVVPKREAIELKVSPDLTVYVFGREALEVGLGVGVGVGLGVADGVGVGLVGAGVATGAGATTLSATTVVEALTLGPFGTRLAKTESTGIALGPEPLRAT